MSDGLAVPAMDETPVARSPRESERLYRSLFENMLNGFAYCRMLFDNGNPHDFVYLAVNAAFESQTGLKNVVGRKVTEVIPGIREADPQLFERYGRVAMTGRPEQFETFVEALQMWFAISVYCPAPEHFVAVFDVITERMRAEMALASGKAFLDSSINAIADPIFIKDENGRFVLVNDAMCTIVGRSQEALLGQNDDIFPEEQAAIFRRIDTKVLATGEENVNEEALSNLSSGQVRVIVTRKTRYVDPAGRRFLVGVIRDITESKRLEAELGHARKLEAVGQLASGIAHEINTPTQFVGDGVHFLKEAFAGYQQLVGQYQRAVKTLEATGGHEALVSEIRATEESIDLPYLQANAPASFESCQEGISRISTIVRAMKEFAHPDQKDKVLANLNQALQTTLAIARNEYKYVAEVVTDLGDLPPVLCHVGDLNQVFLNLIVNAAHAIGDVVGQSGSKGAIRIRTSREESLARIDIADSGAGIPEAIRQRIFDPFFTTKEVGKGTGQGLAIARSVIVTKHGGTLTFDSEVGKGTTFTIRLPIAGE